MFKSLITASFLAALISSAALAQTTSPSGTASGGGMTGSHQSITPNIGGRSTGGAGTDPGITNSTINPGTVDLNRDGRTINPGGVNRAIPPSAPCATGNESAGTTAQSCSQ